ncbi:MAG: sulfite oxidase heme-binding subunit YedZ [Gammaproteobacteria bacterium]
MLQNIFNPTLTQVRLVLKPLVFVTSLIPATLVVGGATGILAYDLGANPVETIQDECGIWGLRFILLTLAMTPLRLILGAAWPLRLRRMLGLFAFFYASLHFLNYLILDQGLEIGAIVEDIIERPFITIGAASILLLLPLAITSTAGWRRRLGRRWIKLHRAVYVVGILVCWHFWWQVKQDISEPLLYVTILVVLLGIRIWDQRRRQQQTP